MDCRLEQINMGKPTKRRCDICGLFGRCTKGLDSHIPIPVDKDAEITRLKEQLARTERLVEVADEFVKRCEAGEVRSVKTYTKFKDALAHLAGKVEG